MSEVTLPCELAERRLTLTEIGAIFVFYSLPKIDADAQSFWSTDEDMVDTGKALVEDGIIKFSKNDDDENIMEIDLTMVDSLKKDFWEIYGDDENDNDILYHLSPYGDKDSQYRYELHPMLYGNRLVYDLRHSEFGRIDDCFPVETLEEGEDFVRWHLGLELEKIKEEDLLKTDERGKR